MLFQLDQAHEWKRSKPKQPAARSQVPIRISKRDLQVLDFLHRYRISDRPVIQSLFFGVKNTRWTVGRMKDLYVHGYIERIIRPGQKPAYRLATRGAQMLAESRGMTGETIAYWGRGDDKDWHPTRLSPQSVDHMLLGAKLRLIFEQASEKARAVVSDWKDQYDLQPTWKTERVEIKLESKDKHTWEEVPVTPDAAFAITTDKGKGYFFLEADRGTERNGRTWQRKVKTYVEYLNSGKFHKKYETGSNAKFRVLIAAPSVKRAVNIINTATKFAPQAAELFLATAFSQINDDLLTVPVWVRGGHTAPQALL